MVHLKSVNQKKMFLKLIFDQKSTLSSPLFSNLHHWGHSKVCLSQRTGQRLQPQRKSRQNFWFSQIVWNIAKIRRHFSTNSCPQTELDGRVRQILFREKCYRKENNCKGFHFSDLKITTKFSQKRWYLFIKRTRVMLLMFNLKNHNKYLLNSFNNSI